MGPLARARGFNQTKGWRASAGKGHAYIHIDKSYIYVYTYIYIYVYSIVYVSLYIVCRGFVGDAMAAPVCTLGTSTGSGLIPG